jgi:DNA-binding NarL/FixJ family response regulator
VTLVLTVRTGHGAIEPVAALWKDGLASRVELEPLHRRDTARLIGQALGGDVETRAGERLWRLTRGNPLFLREFLDDGLRTGRLHNRSGLWRWEGPIVPSLRLAEIVLGHLGELDAGEYRALQALATGEPVGVDHVIALSSEAAVASLERREVISDDPAGRPGEVRASHPLYTAVVRARTPEATLRALRRQLVESYSPPRSHDELLRRSEALLDGEAASSDADVLTRTARRANGMLDHAMAERLARAGIAAGAGAEAHLVLVEAAQWQGHPARSEQLAVEAAPLIVADDDRARLTATRALTLFCGLGRAEDARVELGEALATVRSDDGRAILLAVEAVLTLLSGDPRRAVEQATAVLGAARHGDAAQALAAAAAAAGLAVTGHPERALDIVRAGWEAQEAIVEGTELAFVRVALAQAEVMALHLAGRIRELDRRATELHERNLTAPEWAGDAVACLHRGWAALATGRPASAVRWLGEAATGLQRRDPAGMLPVCFSLLATAKALTGDAEGARASLDDAAQDTAVRLFTPIERMSQAWLAAAENRLADARVHALAAAADAADQGQVAVEAVMLHCALRLGSGHDVVERLRTLRRSQDSPLVAAFAAHAEAAMESGGGGLDRVSRRVEEMGNLLLAADIAAEAAAAHERVGDRRAAAMSSTRAVALARQCGVARTPARDNLAPPMLTSREAEVAGLAARGLGNQAIAARLVVSVRTVEAHLAHAYAKLGITNRSALSAALDSVLRAGPAERPLHAGRERRTLRVRNLRAP